MNWDKVVLITLAVWAVLFGMFTVTNIKVEWGEPIMGFAALILGVVCVIRCFR